MKTSDRNSFGSGSVEFENTLRLIASLPAPQGLENRVQAGLRAISHSAPGRARILAWPVALRLENAWMQSNLARTAAAAAIAIVVVGGGWGVSSRFQPAQPSSAVAVPPHSAGQTGQGGFSSAGARRTPETLNGPVVAHPAMAAPHPAKPVAKTPLHRGKTASAKKAVAQPVAPAAK